MATPSHHHFFDQLRCRRQQAAGTELHNVTVDMLIELFMLGIAHGVAAEAFCQALLRIDAEVRHPEREHREPAGRDLAAV